MSVSEQSSLRRTVADRLNRRGQRERTRERVARRLDRFSESDIRTRETERGFQGFVKRDAREREIVEDILSEAGPGYSRPDVFIDEGEDGLTGGVKREARVRELRESILSEAGDGFKSDDVVISESEDGLSGRIEESARRRELREGVLAEAGEGFTDQDVTISQTDDGLSASIRQQAKERELREDILSEAGSDFSSDDVVISQTDEGLSGRISQDAKRRELREDILSEAGSEFTSDDLVISQTEEGLSGSISESARRRELREDILSEAGEGFTEDDVTISESDDGLSGQIAESARRRELQEDVLAEAGEGFTDEDVTISETDEGLSASIAESARRRELREDVLAEAGDGFAEQDVTISETDDGLSASISQQAQRREAFESLQQQTDIRISEADVRSTDDGYSLSAQAQRRAAARDLQSETETTITPDDIILEEDSATLSTAVQKEEAVAALQDETESEISKSDIRVSDDGATLTTRARLREGVVALQDETDINIGIGDVKGTDEGIELQARAIQREAAAGTPFQPGDIEVGPDGGVSVEESARESEAVESFLAEQARESGADVPESGPDIAEAWADGSLPSQYDLDGDGSVGQKDLQTLVNNENVRKRVAQDALAARSDFSPSDVVVQDASVPSTRAQIAEGFAAGDLPSAFDLDDDGSVDQDEIQKLVNDKQKRANVIEEAQESAGLNLSLTDSAIEEQRQQARQAQIEEVASESERFSEDDYIIGTEDGEQVIKPSEQAIERERQEARQDALERAAENYDELSADAFEFESTGDGGERIEFSDEALYTQRDAIYRSIAANNPGISPEDLSFREYDEQIIVGQQRPQQVDTSGGSQDTGDVFQEAYQRFDDPAKREAFIESRTGTNVSGPADRIAAAETIEDKLGPGFDISEDDVRLTDDGAVLRESVVSDIQQPQTQGEEFEQNREIIKSISSARTAAQQEKVRAREQAEGTFEFNEQVISELSSARTAQQREKMTARAVAERNNLPDFNETVIDDLSSARTAQQREKMQARAPDVEVTSPNVGELNQDQSGQSALDRFIGPIFGGGGRIQQVTRSTRAPSQKLSSDDLVEATRPGGDSGVQFDQNITDRLTRGGILSERPGSNEGLIPGSVSLGSNLSPSQIVGEELSREESQGLRNVSQINLSERGFRTTAQMIRDQTDSFDENAPVTIAGSDIPERALQGVAGLGVNVAGAAAQSPALVDTVVETGANLPSVVSDEGAGDVANAVGGLALRSTQESVRGVREKPVESVAAFIAGAGTSVALGKAAGKFGRLAKDRIRTLGGDYIPTRSLSSEEVIRYVKSDGAEGDKFPSADDPDRYLTSPAEAVTEQSRANVPQEIIERVGASPDDALLKKGLDVEPIGPGRGRASQGFDSVPDETDINPQKISQVDLNNQNDELFSYENPGSFMSPELSPYFLNADTMDSRLGLRPGLPDLGTAPTAVIARVDVEEPNANSQLEFAREMAEREGETTVRTKPAGSDQLNVGEVEAVSPPGAQFKDIGGSIGRRVARQLGIGSDYYTVVNDRRVPIRLVEPDSSGRPQPTRFGFDNRAQAGLPSAAIDRAGFRGTLDDLRRRAEPGTDRPLPPVVPGTGSQSESLSISESNRDSPRTLAGTSSSQLPTRQPDSGVSQLLDVDTSVRDESAASRSVDGTDTYDPFSSNPYASDSEADIESLDRAEVSSSVSKEIDSDRLLSNPATSESSSDRAGVDEVEMAPLPSESVDADSTRDKTTTPSGLSVTSDPSQESKATSTDSVTSSGSLSATQSSDGSYTPSSDPSSTPASDPLYTPSSDTPYTPSSDTPYTPSSDTPSTPPGTPPSEPPKRSPDLEDDDEEEQLMDLDVGGSISKIFGGSVATPGSVLSGSVETIDDVEYSEQFEEPVDTDPSADWVDVEGGETEGAALDDEDLSDIDL